MATSSKKRTSQAVCLPQLIRILLRKLDVNRLDASASKRLTSNITHKISIELLKPTEERTQVRAKGEVVLEGKWYEEETKKPIVTFSGLYEARFVFPPNIKLETLDEWMADAFFKDVLIAQAIPVINLHMFSQLEMMGLNAHTKSIGYKPEAEEWEKQESKEVVPKARRLPRKKISA